VKQCELVHRPPEWSVVFVVLLRAKGYLHHPKNAKEMIKAEEVAMWMLIQVQRLPLLRSVLPAQRVRVPRVSLMECASWEVFHAAAFVWERVIVVVVTRIVVVVVAVIVTVRKRRMLAEEAAAYARHCDVMKEMKVVEGRPYASWMLLRILLREDSEIEGVMGE